MKSSAVILAVLASHAAATAPLRGSRFVGVNSTPAHRRLRMNLMNSLFGSAVGSGARCNYDNLVGRPDSWGKEAAANAVAGVVPTKSDDGYEVATFAGGCFWGIELAYQRMPGVIATAVGYAQGKVAQPTYQEVCTATTGHTEAVQVIYDSKEVSYRQLCEELMSRLERSMFLKDQVGNDRGPQYRHGIYPHTEKQREVASEFIAELQDKAGSKKIYTEIEDAQIFWPGARQVPCTWPRGLPSHRRCDFPSPPGPNWLPPASAEEVRARTHASGRPPPRPL